MITLKTLTQATDQEVFDQVTKHLLTQMKRSVTECDGLHGGCLYRSPDGLKCAAGCLIADDECDPDMEGNSWMDMVNRFTFTHSHEGLIQRLQNVHDGHPPENWLDHFKNLALEFSLEFHA